MTLKDLVIILRSTGYPVAYSHFNDPPSFPYILYLDALSSNMLADNRVYQKGRIIQVELYTDKKDLQAEDTLEGVFEANDIPWEVTEVYLDSERMFQRIYEIGVI